MDNCTPIRATRRATQAEEWALVLAAAGIPHRVEPGEPGWILLVPDAETPRAHAALAAYDEEARGEPDAAIAEAASLRVAWAVGVAVIMVRRRHRLTCGDLVFLRVGWPALFIALVLVGLVFSAFQ